MFQKIILMDNIVRIEVNQSKALIYLQIYWRTEELWILIELQKNAYLILFILNQFDVCGVYDYFLSFIRDSIIYLRLFSYLFSVDSICYFYCFITYNSTFELSSYRINCRYSFCDVTLIKLLLTLLSTEFPFLAIISYIPT